jgi:two-component sensor histidine kinase/CHASE3 domain sensor protein
MTDATRDAGLPLAPVREARRRFVIVLSLALVLSAAVSALFLVRGVDTQIADMVKAYEVRRQARDLILTLVDAETGQRGYLLTQDAEYLEPYQTAIADVDEIYGRLLGLVQDDPAKRVRIEELSEGIMQKRAEMAATITLASTGELEQALDIFRSDAGRELMGTLRDTVRRFVADEDAKLVERNSEMEWYRQLLVVAILAALGGAATLTYLMVTRTQKQVSSLARTSNTLMLQKEELESHIRARTAEVEEARAYAERERARVEALLQDTNHRIGNSLATVSSLLGLQVTRTQSDEVRTALEAAQSRIHAISSGHRRLRLGADLETTNAGEFLEAVVEDLRATQAGAAHIAFRANLEPVVIRARDATTVGIVLGELLTNALKHAFPDGREGQIWISLAREPGDGAIKLTVEDDGRGLGDELPPSEAGLGAMIIRQLAHQYGGKPHYAPRAGGGTVVSVTLPELALVDTDA